MTEIDILRAEITRLRLERDALADRLQETRALLKDTTDRLRSVATAERRRLHDKFMYMHEQAKSTHNHWHFAANVIVEDDGNTSF